MFERRKPKELERAEATPAGKATSARDGYGLRVMGRVVRLTAPMIMDDG